MQDRDTAHLNIRVVAAFKVGECEYGGAHRYAFPRSRTPISTMKDLEELRKSHVEIPDMLNYENSVDNSL